MKRSPNFVDLTGQRFGQLLVLERSTNYYPPWSPKGRSRWLCLCDCGNQRILNADRLKHTQYPTTCCGCKAKRKKTDVVARSIFAKGYSDGDLTFDQFLDLINQDCFWCGSPPRRTTSLRKHSLVWNGLDRLDNDRPHDRDNVVPCCWTCNDKRSNTPVGEFLEWIQAIFRNRIAA